MDVSRNSNVCPEIFVGVDEFTVIERNCAASKKAYEKEKRRLNLLQLKEEKEMKWREKEAKIEYWRAKADYYKSKRARNDEEHF